MSKFNPKSNFFLYKLVKPDTTLTRDEPSIITRVLWMSAITFLIIDLLVIIFFIKTNNRIQIIHGHNFTQEVERSMIDSKKTHSEYAQEIKRAIQTQNLEIRAGISEFEKAGLKLENSQILTFDIKDLEELKSIFVKLEEPGETGNDLTQKAKDLLKKVDKKINDYFSKMSFVYHFNENAKRVEMLLDNLVKSIKQNLDNFLHRLNGLAEIQHENQKNLYIKMNDVLKRFQEVYEFVYKNQEYRTINNFYKSPFYEFENDYIPFVEQLKKEHHEAKLTYTVELDLDLPRVYFCNLQAYATGMGNFQLEFEYVDHHSKDDEEILAFTEKIGGSFEEPISVNQVLMFTLHEGKHFLYLRAISERASSQIHMKDLAFECVSYRNFHPKEISY